MGPLPRQQGQPAPAARERDHRDVGEELRRALVGAGQVVLREEEHVYAEKVPLRPRPLAGGDVPVTVDRAHVALGDRAHAAGLERGGPHAGQLPHQRPEEQRVGVAPGEQATPRGPRPRHGP